MVLRKDQLTFLFIGILAIAITYGCGGDSGDGSSTPAPTSDPEPRVTIEQFFDDENDDERENDERENNERAFRSAEDGWFQVRLKAKPVPKDQDLIVRVRLLYTELNISEEQVKDLDDDAFDEILWFRILQREEASEATWIRSKITAVLQVVELSRRHKFESDTLAVDGSTIPGWWEPSPYEAGDPSVLIRHYE